MTQFARDFVASIEGTSLDISTKELSGGARIYYIFNDVFGSALSNIDATHNLDNQDIRTAIRNSTGPPTESVRAGDRVRPARQAADQVAGGTKSTLRRTRV